MDIVKQLRRTRTTMLGTDDEQHFADCHEAAQEIVRLRGVVAAAGGHAPMCSEPVAWRYWKDKFGCWEYSDVPLEFPAVPAGTKMEALCLATGPHAVEVAAATAGRDRCAKLAAWLQWCLDNCDDSPEWNFGTAAADHMRALLAGGDAPMPNEGLGMVDEGKE